MNNYYKNIAKEIEGKINKSKFDYKHYLEKSKQSEEPFNLLETYENEVQETIKSMSNKASVGPDGISNKIIKKISPFIIKELTNCINKSFNEVTFPESIKITKITPVFKKNERSLPENWRPIAQLSPFSKIYEKVFLKQVNEQLDRFEIISKNQFGFRSKHSTIHPILLIKNFIERELQKKKHVIMVTLDIQKAFDCVKTSGLLQNKIKFYTKSQKITEWIDSYYRNRKQYTIWGREKSETVNNHKISIVQGSNIGSKMFNFYINDLPKITKCETFLFADDCALLFSNHDPKILNKEVNDEINLIKDYFDSNFLSVSIDKSNFLHFQPKNKKGEKIQINIGGKSLEEKNNITYLGVIIDNKLQFNEHFSKIYNKAKNGLKMD